MSRADKLNFVKDGVSKLPPGFRFQPTDEEIVFQYLAPKIFSFPMPASVVPEIEICRYDPWELPGDSDQHRYFFSNKEIGHWNGTRRIRATGGGYWKAISGSEKRIIFWKKMPIMGFKKTLVFYKGKDSRSSRTGWIMHEYHLVFPGNTGFHSQQRKSSQGSLIQIGDWFLSHIFLKNRSRRPEAGGVRPRFFNFMIEEKSEADSSSTSSSFSGSSDLTDVFQTANEENGTYMNNVTIASRSC